MCILEKFQYFFIQLFQRGDTFQKGVTSRKRLCIKASINFFWRIKYM
jgi:hypothetical protein